MVLFLKSVSLVQDLKTSYHVNGFIYNILKVTCIIINVTENNYFRLPHQQVVAILCEARLSVSPLTDLLKVFRLHVMCPQRWPVEPPEPRKPRPLKEKMTRRRNQMTPKNRRE